MKRGMYQGKPASVDSVKKKLTFEGMPVHLDRPKGFVMSGEDAQGKTWERHYKLDYGFIPGTQGGDGDGIDVFLGPDEASSEDAHWVSMLKADGSFDEYKVMLGFKNQAAAKAAFLEHIPAKFMGRITSMRLPMMRAMLGFEPAEKVAWAAFFDELGQLMGDR